MDEPEVRQRRSNKEENRNEMFFRGNVFVPAEGRANSNTDCH